MTKKNEFKKDLEKIVEIYFLCKESYLVLRELYKTIDNSEFLINLKFNGTFFRLTKINYWRVIVLQLSKIYMERERYNITRLLDKCKTGNYFETLNIDQDFINEQLKKINEKQEHINNIKKQRDKVFAHEDVNNHLIINNVTLDETKDLIDLCENIIFRIYNEVYDTHYDFEMSNSAIDNLKYILKSLNEKESEKELHEKKILEEFIKSANSKSNN